MTQPAKPKNAAARPAGGAGAAAPQSNFIRALIARDRAAGRHGGRVRTRFPPEPNGYLHIGHAKSVCLNFTLAAENDGQCHLRFDDTNPLRESQEYVDAIIADIRWLGFAWAGELRYTSDYFTALKRFAEYLIHRRLAYVDSQSPDAMRASRGTLTEPGRASPDRDQATAANLRDFQAMWDGRFGDGERTLRARIDMAAANVTMRDPVLCRIRHERHHRTGNDWCVYPTYDFSHCIADSIEGITHSLCTLEFEDHRPLYDWLLDKFHGGFRDWLLGEADQPGTATGQAAARRQAGAGKSDQPRHPADGQDAMLRQAAEAARGEPPQQTEFAKLRLNYTVMGKRKLRQLVEEGIVTGWDDPRMPTLAGLRRRGVSPAAIRNFCESVGVSRADSVVDLAMLEFAIRDDLDKTAPRAMAVLRPLPVTLVNLPESRTLSLARHPKDEAMGRREVPLDREIVIEADDFAEQPPAGFKRLVPGGEVRLRGAYVIRCEGVIKDDSGAIQSLECSVDLATLGQRPAGRKVAGVIHWVSAERGVTAVARQYDRLFRVPDPEGEADGDFRSHLNPDSLVVMEGCVLEPAAAELPHCQFERLGYYARDDQASAAAGLPVFNRTVSLRDSWGGKT